MNTLGERIALLRGTMSEEAFAKKLGIAKGKSVIESYERGESQPGAELLSVLCNLYQVHADWLLDGKGEKYLPVNTMDGLDHFLASDGELTMIPLVTARLTAGEGSFEVSGETEQRYAFRTDWLSGKGRPLDMVLMRVDGDSMEPRIADGDMVLIDQGKREAMPGKLFAVGIDDAISIKLIDSLQGKLVLRSYNARYAPIEIDLPGQETNAPRIMGKAIWLGREL